jgi:hypothetical protein
MRLNISSFLTRNPLVDLSVKFANDADAYAALKIFPVHMVPKKTGSFYVYSKDNLRVETLDAPSGTEAKVGDYSVSTKTFTLAEKAHKMLVLDKDARDADVPVADLDAEAALQNMDKLLIGMESAMVTKACATGSYPAALVNTLTGGTDTWLDAGSDPVDDYRELGQEIFESCGKYPNSSAMSKKAMDILKINPSVLDRVKYTGLAVTEEILKTLLDMNEFIISKAIKNTAQEGAADSLAEIWGDEVLLFYKDPAARLKSMTYGKCFMGQSMYVKSIDAPQLGRGLGAHHIESGWEFALEFIGRDGNEDSICGGLIDNVY